MRRRRIVTAFLGLLLVLAGCQAGPAAEQEPDWPAVKSFVYQLQRANLKRIGETGFDLVVVSIVAAGGSP